MLSDVWRSETNTVKGIERHMSSFRRPLLFAAGLAVTALLAVTASAFADTATLTVTDSSGQSDPAAGLPRVFTVTGTAGTPGEHAYVKYRATGGAPCAPTADTDPGTALDGAQGPFYNGSPTDNGTFTESDVITWPQPQTLQFCIWVATNTATATTPFTQNVTFRAPTGSLGATFSPQTPVAGQPFSVTVTGASEAPESVFATVRAAGSPCAPTFATDTGSNLVGGAGQAVNGSYSFTATANEAMAGAYNVCLWLASSPTDGSPIAGPTAVKFTVTAPPPPPPPSCIVPNPTSKTNLATVEAALMAAHCTVGPVTQLASPKVPLGDVIGLSPAPLSTLPEGTTVEIEISTGPACIVPKIPAGTSLAKAEAALRKGHCGIGKVTHVRSKARRGTVVRISPAAGTIAATNAHVNIVESLGKRG